jgi:hypothetical protein
MAGVASTAAAKLRKGSLILLFLISASKLEASRHASHSSHATHSWHPTRTPAATATAAEKWVASAEEVPEYFLRVLGMELLEASTPAAGEASGSHLARIDTSLQAFFAKLVIDCRQA